jgi:HEPN domain-containing protein
MIGTASDWLAKAHDDLQTVVLLLTFDDYPRAIAAFHCQQAAEKSLKALLTAYGVPFLYRHDLGYLLDLCLDVDPACAELEPHIDGLTPYAVEMRYPADLPLTPTASEVKQFYRQAQTVYRFVESRIVSPED